MFLYYLIPTYPPVCLQSGKLVMKLFEKIFELVEDKDCLVCVLIGKGNYRRCDPCVHRLEICVRVAICTDEVESLTSARQSALSGSEPSDAIRVVNALLTQIDKLRIHENVLILCTSNLTQALGILMSACVLGGDYALNCFMHRFARQIWRSWIGLTSSNTSACRIYTPDMKF